MVFSCSINRAFSFKVCSSGVSFLGALCAKLVFVGQSNPNIFAGQF